MKMEKQMFGRPMCAGGCRDNGTPRDSDLEALPSFPASSSPYSLQIFLMTAFLEEQAFYLNSFRQLVGRSKFLLGSFGP